MVEKIEYNCLSCSFRFSRRKSLEVKSCPNCSKESVEPLKKIGADDLIREVDSM